MPRQGLTGPQRSAIHDMALKARELLVQEIRDLLVGTYGLHPDGRREPLDQLPTLQGDPEHREIRRRLELRLDQEQQRGATPRRALEALVTEAAFTQLNRLAAYKMMEARGLIREALRGYPRPNGLLFYLADHPEEMALHASGRREDAHRAYCHYLLDLARRISQQLRVLFDPEDLPGLLFPRAGGMERLVALLNDETLAPAWQAEETVGWIYQYFNEPELQAAFAKVSSGTAKFSAEDIPSATQLFTPHWIVRYLVHNTLGRLWLQMHPDSRLGDDGTLDYLIPAGAAPPPVPPRPASEITLLDPACGSMHFGLVAYDVYHAMYREELERAGEPGWAAEPSVAAADEIPAAILAHNLHGIDLDKRAVQLAALALYLRARRDAPDRPIQRVNLAVADVRPIDGQRLGTYLREARLSPTLERLVRTLWGYLEESRQLGSLLPLERRLERLVAEARGEAIRPTLFDHQRGLVDAAAAQDEYWAILGGQVLQSLDDFARRHGPDQRLFATEARKGFELLHLLERRYDVLTTNPPYMTAAKMNTTLKDLVADTYPEGKRDLYAAFIQRCLELAEDDGYVGMLTMHSWMFLSSYEDLRSHIRQGAATESMAHCGPALFSVGNPGTLQTTAFVLRREADAARRRDGVGTYIRLVQAGEGEGKRRAFEKALEGLRAG